MDYIKMKLVDRLEVMIKAYNFRLNNALTSDLYRDYLVNDDKCETNILRLYIEYVELFDRMFANEEVVNGLTPEQMKEFGINYEVCNKKLAQKLFLLMYKEIGYMTYGWNYKKETFSSLTVVPRDNNRNNYNKDFFEQHNRLVEDEMICVKVAEIMYLELFHLFRTKQFNRITYTGTQYDQTNNRTHYMDTLNGALIQFVNQCRREEEQEKQASKRSKNI